MNDVLTNLNINEVLDRYNQRKYSPIFKSARVAKKIWRIIKTIVAIWGENMLGYLSLDIICSS